MKIYRKADEEYIDLFDPQDQDRVYDRDGNIRKHVQAVFDMQDKWARKSDAFRRVLEQEISDDPRERFERTEDLKAKTRNALLTISVYYNYNANHIKEYNQAAWEENLLTNPFYGLVG